MNREEKKQSKSLKLDWKTFLKDIEEISKLPDDFWIIKKHKTMVFRNKMNFDFADLLLFLS